MEEYQRSPEQIASLKALHRTLRDRKKADRVKAVVLLGTGYPVAQVAEILFLDETTVRNYYEKYVQGGEEGLLTLFYTGRHASLSEVQQQELTKHLDENTYLTSREVAYYIAQTFGVSFRPSGVKDLLHRLGFVYKKPKHVPGKHDLEAQKEFLEKYESLKKTKGENDPIYFCDACHPPHNSIPAYGWIKRGTDKELRSNGGRKRVNINGAVNVESLEISTDFSKTINDRSTLRLLRKLEKKHPEAEEIHVILDNATYYKSKWLKKEQEGSRIRLHYLPGYSPNLNLIERLWKFLKKKVLHNTYYEKFDDFVAACKGFFRCRKKHREELKTLLADHFHLFEKKAEI